MELISAHFNVNDSLEDLFVKYKDAFGYLFLDGNRFLCDNDYKCLYRILAREAEWDKAQLVCNTYTYYRFERMKKEKKFFFRIFGIYLREATFRYSGDFTGEGAFWKNLKKGILNDLQDAFQCVSGQERRNRIDNRGETFWVPSRGGYETTHETDIQSELTRSHGELIRRIFSYFNNPFCRVSECGSNVYVKHLTKLAGCPLNFNPVRSDYSELRMQRSRNSIENYVNSHGSSTLDYAPGLRSQLTDRICDFFDFFADLGVANLNDAKVELAAWCGITNQDHYYYSWLEEEFQYGNNRISRRQGAAPIQREYQNNDFKVVFNTSNHRVSISCPDTSYVTHILRENDLETRGSYDVVSDGEVLFRIGSYGHIAGHQTIASEQFNRNVFKLFACDKIQFCDEYDEISNPVKNPWVQKVSLFDCKGRPSNSADSISYSYLILQPQELVRQIVNGSYDIVDDALGGLNVYKITIDADAEWISVITDLQTLHYDVQDSRYLHLYQDKTNRKDVFIHQKPRLKFGIGNVQFSHIGNSDFRNVQLPNGVYLNYSDNSRRLILENRVHEIRQVQETIVGDKMLPRTVLLPSDWMFWMARENNCFCAYLKPTAGTHVDCKFWDALGNGLYRYKVTDYSAWKNDGFPIRFLGDETISFGAKCPYFNANTIRNNWKNSNFFLGANPFDDVIPDKGKYFFSWMERGCLFKIKVDYGQYSLRQCLKAFGLLGNFPELTFGWSYENTMFTEVFSASQNYQEPERPGFVYEKNDDERELWLRCLLSDDIVPMDRLIPYNRFSEDLQKEIKNKLNYGWFRYGNPLLDIMRLFYEKDVCRFREDLRDISNFDKSSWLHKWGNLSEELHNQLTVNLEEKLRINDIQDVFIQTAPFLWSFVSNDDISHYVDFQIQKKNNQQTQEKLDEFLDVWNRNCDENLKNFPIRDLLQKCKSFSRCSQINFNLYTRYLNSWLSGFVAYMEVFHNHLDMIMPVDFFAEDSQNRPLVNGRYGYTCAQLMDLSACRMNLYVDLKRENELYGDDALSNDELIKNVFSPLKFEIQPGRFYSYDTLKNNEMFCFNDKSKGMLWLGLIKKKWIAVNRSDLCLEINCRFSQQNFQDELQRVSRNPVSKLFRGITLDKEIEKLANHLRFLLNPIFEEYTRRWNNAKIGWPSLSNIEMPPEVFLEAPRDNFAEYFSKKARQWNGLLR